MQCRRSGITPLRKTRRINSSIISFIFSFIIIIPRYEGLLHSRRGMFHFLTEERTLMNVGHKSIDTNHSNIRKNRSHSFLWKELIISESYDIRSIYPKRFHHIFFITEKNHCFGKCMDHIIESSELGMNRGTEFHREHTSISCNNDNKLISELCCFSEIIFMPRMKEVKCTKSHDTSMGCIFCEHANIFVKNG